MRFEFDHMLCDRLDAPPVRPRDRVAVAVPGQFCSWPSSPCTCQTDLVQSNFNRLTPLGLTSASRDMKLTCSMQLAFLRCALGDLVRFRLTAGLTGLWESGVSE